MPPVSIITTRTEDDYNITGTEDDCGITGTEYDCGITGTDDGTNKLEDNNSNTNVVPFPLTELYDLKYCALSQKSLEEKGEELFINLNISESQCREIERATRKQRNCTEWQQQRKGCITASNFHDVFTAKDTVIYRLIAAATITFSKLKGAATKRGRLLYEGGH